MRKYSTARNVSNVVMIQSLAPSFFALAGEVRPRHTPGQATDIVLQGDVLPFELVMIGFDKLDLFSESIQTRLQSSGVPKRPLQISIRFRTSRPEKRRCAIHVLI